MKYYKVEWIKFTENEANVRDKATCSKITHSRTWQQEQEKKLNKQVRIVKQEEVKKHGIAASSGVRRKKNLSSFYRQRKEKDCVSIVLTSHCCTPFILHFIARRILQTRAGYYPILFSPLLALYLLVYFLLLLVAKFSSG